MIVPVSVDCRRLCPSLYGNNRDGFPLSTKLGTLTSGTDFNLWTMLKSGVLAGHRLQQDYKYNSIALVTLNLPLDFNTGKC